MRTLTRAVGPHTPSHTPPVAYFLIGVPSGHCGLRKAHGTCDVEEWRAFWGPHSLLRQVCLFHQESGRKVTSKVQSLLCDMLPVPFGHSPVLDRTEAYLVFIKHSFHLSCPPSPFSVKTNVHWWVSEDRPGRSAVWGLCCQSGFSLPIICPSSNRRLVANSGAGTNPFSLTATAPRWAGFGQTLHSEIPRLHRVLRAVLWGLEQGRELLPFHPSY